MWTLVTGGARRFGAEICRTLARSGRNIVVHYRTSEQEALELVKELKGLGVQAEALQGDFADLDSTQTFLNAYLQRFKDTNGLVNNVGNYVLGTATETKPEIWRELFQENLIASLHLIQGLLPSLKKTKGRVVNIGMTGCGTFRANTHAAAYNTTKSALWMLTQSLAKELASSKICVNMVSPGYMEGSVDLPKELPMDRLATYTEVANAVAFLMDPSNSYITGQNLEVAGAVRL